MEQRTALVARGKALKSDLEGVEARLAALEDTLQAEGQRLPNLTHPDAPAGGEEHAAVLREVGAQRAFGFEARDHVAIGEDLGLIDFESGALVSREAALWRWAR